MQRKPGQVRTLVGGETGVGGRHGEGEVGARDKHKGMGTASTGVDGRKGSVWGSALGRAGVCGDWDSYFLT